MRLPQHRPSLSTARRLAAGLFALACGTGASLATAQTSAADIHSRYQAEVAACRNGSSGQALDACLLEARNARAEAQRGRLGGGSAVDPENALRRCDVFKGDDRATCRDRISKGSTSGSVAGGGILREYRTIEPAPSAAPASAPR